MYQVIVADPPWTFQTWSDSGKGKSAEQHYQTMTLDDIAGLPVAQVAHDDAALLMWATWPLLPGERVQQPGHSRRSSEA